MSTWESASLSGIPERTGAQEEAPREAVRTHVLDVAEELINQHGLTVGLGHLSFDEIILKAEVSRTTAYRVWPRKERFLEDLLRRLADVVSPCYGPLDGDTAQVTFATLRKHADHLATPEGRRKMLVEACRVTADSWVEGASTSPQWRTYIALMATIRSIGNEKLTNELRDRMYAVDNQAAIQVSAFYMQALALLGFHLRELAPVDLVLLGGAALTGAVFLTDIRPTVAAPLGKIDPFGTGMRADWSPASIAYTGAVLGALEPDPDYDLEQALSSFG